MIPGGALLPGNSTEVLLLPTSVSSKPPSYTALVLLGFFTSQFWHYSFCPFSSCHHIDHVWIKPQDQCHDQHLDLDQPLDSSTLSYQRPKKPCKQ